METTTWNSLPCELIEKILLDVPAADMLFNKTWVCKTWTNLLLQPKFWIRKLRKISITINDEILSVLNGFERKIQIACLYHACLNENNITFETQMNEDNLQHVISRINISDDFEEMLKAASSLVTRSVDTAKLILYKEIIPVLPLLLKLLSVRGSCVTICDFYGFWNFSSRYEFVQMLKGSDEEANIQTLIGCVSTLDGLAKKEESDEYYSVLRLSIAVDENNKAIDPGVYDKRNVIQVMHIQAGTDVSLLKRSEHCPRYIISGLDSTNKTWMTDDLDKLGPYGIGGYSLILLNCEMDWNSMMLLFNCWDFSDMGPDDIMCATSALNAKDARKLNKLAHGFWRRREVEYFMLFKSDQELTQSKKFQDLLYDF